MVLSDQNDSKPTYWLVKKGSAAKDIIRNFPALLSFPELLKTEGRSEGASVDVPPHALDFSYGPECAEVSKKNPRLADGALATFRKSRISVRDSWVARPLQSPTPLLAGVTASDRHVRAF